VKTRTVVLAAMLITPGCTHQRRTASAPQATGAAHLSNEQGDTADTESLSIGPVPTLPQKGPVPKLRIAMSEEEVTKVLATHGNVEWLELQLPEGLENHYVYWGQHAMSRSSWVAMIDA
jgi:hypothetical protein